MKIARGLAALPMIAGQRSGLAAGQPTRKVRARSLAH